MDGHGTDDRRMHQGRTPGLEPRPHERHEDAVDLRDEEAALGKRRPDAPRKLAKGSHTVGGTK